MKKIFTIIFATFILLFVNKVNAQTLVCTKPDGDVFDSKAEMVLVLIKSTSSEVTKVRIVPQKNDLIMWQEITPNKTVAINLKLEKGENSFDILGFNSDREVIADNSCRVSVRQVLAPPNNKQSNNNSVAYNQNSPNKTNLFVQTPSPTPNPSASPSPSPATSPEPELKSQAKSFRAVVGLEVVGASSSPSEQQPFFDLFFSTPIGSQYSNAKGLKKHLQFSVWGNTRFSSSPVENITSLSKFTVPTFASNFVGTASSLKFNELVKSFEFRAGGELQIFRSFRPYGGLISGRSAVSLIFSAGAVSPLTFNSGALFYEIPKVNNGADVDPKFKELFPTITTQKTVAFVAPERERFYRQYFGGFRIKTYYLKENANKDIGDEERDDLVPGMFDITFGQNEAVTNKLTGVILRLDGSMPIPIYKNTLFVFGSAQMRFGRNKDQNIPSLFLKQVLPTELNNSEVLVVPANQNPLLRSNRDIFRIGVGIDLLKLFNPDKKSSETPESQLKPGTNTNNKP